MVQKYVMGSPLYSQEQELNRQGITLTRQAMSNWMLTASRLYLTPVWERLHTELVGHEVLHADETTLQVLHEEGKKAQSKSYLWLYRTSRLSYANTNRVEAEKMQEAFCPGLRGIYIQTGMPDTTISRMILLWWDV